MLSEGESEEDGRDEGWGRGGMGGSIDVDGSMSRPHGRPSNSWKESSEWITEGTRDFR